MASGAKFKNLLEWKLVGGRILSRFGLQQI